MNLYSQMNQASTTYRTDYVPYGWLQSNVTSLNNEFCTSDNIDDCLRYISQEFCALGYPSIYNNSNTCPYAVNCDIVKFLNATFELLRSYNEHIQVKEDLQNRNQRLCTDLNVLNKKNAQLKNNLDQIERKYASALERERQLKEKNERLTQLLKTEKDETKKLASQIQQLKIAHQRELRKYENSMNQIKAKLNQLLSDKNPSKKIANISSSHSLPRNGGQRGKWKTESIAKSSLDEMYNSVISSYENRCADMVKERNIYHDCLTYIQSEVLEIISILRAQKENVSTSDTFILNAIKYGGQNPDQDLEKKFKFLLTKVKEWALQLNESHNKISEEIMTLQSKISQYEKRIEEEKESSQVVGSEQFSEDDLDKSVDLLTRIKEENERYNVQKERLEGEKIALSKLITQIEREKADVAAQKLGIIKLAVQQKAPESQWHQGLTCIPSISVITIKNGLTGIPTPKQLKLCLSAPDRLEESLTPLWEHKECTKNENFQSRSEGMLPVEEKTSCSIGTQDVNFSNFELPSWATSCSTVQNVISESHLENSISPLNENDISLAMASTSTNDLELVREPSSEELNLLRLKAAVEDIEQKRNKLSASSI